MKSKRHDGGFTLLEVAVAMCATAVLSLGVMLAFSTSGTQDRGAYETTRTQSACVALMEQIEAFSFDQLMLLDGQQLSFASDRWTFQVAIDRVNADLLRITTGVAVTSDGSTPMQIVTLRSRKQEA